jgi:hypothetical protein
MSAKQNELPLTRLILNRYGCQYNDRSEEFVSQSASLQKMMDGITKGVDTHKQSDNIKDTMWSCVREKPSCESVLTSLNMRGVRESTLHAGLSDKGVELPEEEAEEEMESSNKSNKSTGKETETNEIDKSLFETMDDYIEGNLRDHLLEIEERLWVGGIGLIKCEDRVQWSTNIEQGMVKLIKCNKNTSKNTSKHKSPSLATPRAIH